MISITEFANWKKTFISRLAGFFFLLHLFSFGEVSGQEIIKTHEINLSWENGYGPFTPPFRILQWKARKRVDGFAAGEPVFTGVSDSASLRSVLWFDTQQYVYQSYHAGRISKETFNDYFPPDLRGDKALSEKEINCFVNIVYSVKGEGEASYQLDTNNDFNFSNESTFSPSPLIWEKLDSLWRLAPRVGVQLIYKDKPIDLQVPVVVLREGKKLLTNFAHHAAGHLRIDGKDFLIRLSRGFGAPDDFQYSIVAIADDFIGRRFKPEEERTLEQWVTKNQYISIGDRKFKNLNFNLNTMTLTLGEVQNDPDSVITSNQIGSRAIKFMVNDFLTEKVICLDSLIGKKYIYLDFWGTWCSPCVKDIPNIKKLHDSIPTSELQIIGVAVNEKPEKFREFLKKNAIEWPQILSNEENGIVKDYNINSYPTSYLIDKSGKIVAINLSGGNLTENIKRILYPKEN